MRFLPLAVALFAFPALAQARSAPDSFADLAAKLLPGVVNISSTTNAVAQAPGRGPEIPVFPPGSPFEQFFKDFQNPARPPGTPPAPQGQRPRPERRGQSLGSGFIIDTAGIVVTNNHVIDGADEITVILQDNTTIKATLLGRDERTDIAILKITTDHPLVAVSFGDSEKSRVGDWVLAIGNPFGLGGSVTAGIVSARGRNIEQGPYDNFIQTDAAINKGNSGGPLFNMDGEVIGINTAIISPSGGSIGIGFAVPSDSATVIVDQLRKHGEARRGWLGVKIRSISEDMVEALGLKEGTGALIESVTPGGPAAKAGMTDGDVVLKFDGRDINSVRALTRAVAQTPIDKTVDVEVLRKNQKKMLQIAIGRLVEEEKPAKGADAKTATAKDKDKSDTPKVDGSAPIIGLKLAPLDDPLRKKYNIDAKVKGVVVLEVDPQSPAAQKGVRIGDVIVEAAQDAVSAVADVAASIEKVKKAGRRAILLRLEDGRGDLRFVAVPLS